MHVVCSFRCQEGLKFLNETEGQWQPRGSLVNHIWWHRGLYHFQLGQFEEALTLLDDVILPNCRKMPESFVLSDCTALLMRLEMECQPQGVDLKDRWREVANMYSNIIEATATRHLFYDFHALLGCLYGDDKSSADKLLDSLTTFSRISDRDYPEILNGKLLNRFGLQLCQGLKAFAEKEFDEAYALLRPIRNDWNQSLSGSRAQVDILNQVLVQAAIKSGNRHGAKQLLKERWSTCGVQDSENISFNSRLQQKFNFFERLKITKLDLIC